MLSIFGYYIQTIKFTYSNNENRVIGKNYILNIRHPVYIDST